MAACSNPGGTLVSRRKRHRPDTDHHPGSGPGIGTMAEFGTLERPTLSRPRGIANVSSLMRFDILLGVVFAVLFSDSFSAAPAQTLPASDLRVGAKEVKTLDTPRTF